MHSRADVSGYTYLARQFEIPRIDRRGHTDISLDRCNSVTPANEMDGSFSAKCQSFVDLVTTRVRRQRKGTKCTKRFKPKKVTYFRLYISQLRESNLFRRAAASFAGTLGK